VKYYTIEGVKIGSKASALVGKEKKQQWTQGSWAKAIT
jgi:hypothetical protein